MDSELVPAELRERYAGYDWQLVQEKKVRSVYRLVEDGEAVFYVKVFHPTGAFLKMRNRCASRAAHEARTLEALRAAGITVPEVVEEMRRGSVSVLVTRAVPGAEPVEGADEDVRATVLLELSCILLERGFRHGDLHAGNVVIEEEGESVLLDVYEVRPIKDIRDKHVVELFAQVLHDLELTDEDLRPYLRRLRAVDLLPAIRKRADVERRERVERRVRRSLRSGSFAEEVRGKGFRALVCRGAEIDLTAVLAEHDRQVAGKENLLKFQDKTQLSRVGDLCVKSYRKARPCTGAYARRSWEGLLTLKFHGFAVAEPVSLVLYADGRSVLVTAYEAASNLDRELWHRLEVMDVAERLSLARLVGDELGRMHARGVFHADLKACNLKIDGGRLVFLDTDRVTQGSDVSREHRFKNLVQLNTSVPGKVNRGLRMACLQAYAARTGDDPRELYGEVWNLSRDEEIVFVADDGDHFESWPGSCVQDGDRESQS